MSGSQKMRTQNAKWSAHSQRERKTVLYSSPEGLKGVSQVLSPSGLCSLQNALDTSEAFR